MTGVRRNFFQVVLNSPKLAAGNGDRYDRHPGPERQESGPLRTRFQRTANGLASLRGNDHAPSLAERLPRGGNSAPVWLAAVDPENANHIRHLTEHGDVAQFNFSNKIGEFRQSRQRQDRIRVTQVIYDDQRRAAAGVILQPANRRLGADES